MQNVKKNVFNGFIKLALKKFINCTTVDIKL